MNKKSLPLHPHELSYGVMVAQQFLVLFVVVRIRLGQLEKPRSSKSGAFSLLSQRKNFISVQLPFGLFDEKKGFFLFYKRKIMYLCIQIPCL